MINAAGNVIAPIAIAFAVLELTGSATALGLVVACRSLVPAAFILFGVVLTDRLPKRVVMVGCTVVGAAAEAATAVLLLNGVAHVGYLAVLQVITGTAGALLFPALQAALPQTVPSDSLYQANVFSRMAVNAIGIGGAALGGILVATVGSGWAIGVDAASFGVAAALFALLRLPGAGPLGEPRPDDDLDGSKSGAKPNVFRELADGWRDFRSRAWLWSTVLQFVFVYVAIGAMFDVLGPLTAKVHLGGAGSWGLVMSGFTGGLLTGGLVASRLRHVARPMVVATLSTVLFVPFIALLAVPVVMPVLLVAAFLAGIGIEIATVSENVTVQRHIPPNRLSSTVAYGMFSSLVFLPLGAVVAGPLEAAIGRGSAVAVCALGVLVPTVAVLAVRDVWAVPGEPTVKRTSG